MNLKCKKSYKSTYMKNICLLLGLLMVSGALGAADYLEGKCGDKIPKDGLIGYWPFKGNANDESGKGNHGTLMGTNKPQPTTDRNGNEYSAYLFGGGSPTSLNNSNNHNYIKVANSPSMHLDNEMSVSFWMQQEYFYGHSGAHLIYTDAISDPSVRFSIFCKAGDGMVHLNLTVAYEEKDSTVNICHGSSFTIAGHTYTESIITTDTIVPGSGICNTIVHLMLFVRKYDTTIYDTTCANQP